MSLECKRCGSGKYVKNGYTNGKQRYKCKECGMNYIEGDLREKYGIKDHLKVIKLYLENCGIRTIERLTGISNSQISKWISRAAEDIRGELSRSCSNIRTIQDIAILEIDELCTYIKKDQRMEENLPLYGLLLIGTEVKLLILR